MAALVLALSLGGCAVGRLTSDDVAAKSNLRQSFLAQAAMLSKSAWDEVRSSSSRFSAWATVLMEGREASDPSVLAASSQATSPAASYLARKAQLFANPQEQLKAVVGDLDEKTQQVDAFIAFAAALAADYRRHSGETEQATASHQIVDQTAVIAADRLVMVRAIGDLKSQMATYEAVERRLQNERPELDTSALSRALAVFDARIEALGGVADGMGAPST